MYVENTSFDVLSFLASIGEGRFCQTYRTMQHIFLQGDPADDIFYLKNGSVSLSVVSKQGKEGIVALIDSGSFFGEVALLGQSAYADTATATAESSIVRVSRDTMLRALRNHPALSQFFTQFLINRNSRIEEDLVNLYFSSSEQRLARLLLRLANSKSCGNVAEVPKFSQEVLAAQVGTTRSRINFFMNKFRDQGLIDYGSGCSWVKVYPELAGVIADG